MKYVYEERKDKFRMFSGDLLETCSIQAYVVQLPISGRMEDARMLSWVVQPMLESTMFPVSVPSQVHVPLLEQIQMKDSAAKSFCLEERTKI